MNMNFLSYLKIASIPMMALLTTALLLAFVPRLSVAQPTQPTSTPAPAGGAGVTRTESPTLNLRDIQRIRPLGPASIDCTTLSDSRCLSPSGSAPRFAPVCTVQVGQSMLNLTGASIATSVTAVCSQSANEFNWAATVGALPTGQTSNITFTAGGTYCFSVAGRNLAVFRDFGARSAQACVTVSGAPPACTGSNYSITSGCAVGLIGSYFTDYTFNTATCQHDVSVRDYCTTPVCTGGQYWNGSSCVCSIGQTWDGMACVSSPPPPPPPSCDPNAFSDRSVTCPVGQTGSITERAYNQCPANVLGSYSQVSNTCAAAIPTCTGGRTWNGSFCACGAGTTWNGVSCEPNTLQCTSPQVLVNGVCQLPACNPTATSSATCSPPTTGMFTRTTTYTGAMCTPQSTDDSAAVCQQPTYVYSWVSSTRTSLFDEFAYSGCRSGSISCSNGGYAQLCTFLPGEAAAESAVRNNCRCDESNVGNSLSYQKTADNYFVEEVDICVAQSKNAPLKNKRK
jgi:hypothetical protein